MNKQSNGNMPISIITLFFIFMTSTPPYLFGQPYENQNDDIVIQEVWIPMSDSILLAADLYMPAQLKIRERLPIILEYLPYRKDEGRSNRYSLFSYFVNRGYIVARVDIRGTGRSKGRLVDGEYSEQEQVDGEAVIEWLSKQDFSNGKVAMLGISWGGFNALHMAMRKPPALKTIISLMSTDDTYEDDVHFIDGMMHIDAYEIGRDLANVLPGAPEFLIDEAYFEDRFDTEPWLLKYKRHQNDGPFWDRTSLNEDYSRIDIPVFIVGGWYDGYRDFVPRMIQHADVPLKAILGPWNHTWPNTASPGPAIEWRQMVVRWLDHWLKDQDTGILEEPSVYYYERDWHKPGLDLDYIPGYWKEYDTWPASRDTTLYLHKDHQLTSDPSTFVHSLEYIPSVGIEASGSVMWWGDWAPDQRRADVYSLAYDSAPVSDSLIILGFPEVNLFCSADIPNTHWLVRLSDVAPNGMVTQVTGAGYKAGSIDLRNDEDRSLPDGMHNIKIELHATSWTFRKGHKIRISINNAQWPMIWPSSSKMTTRIQSDKGVYSFLSLPVSSGLARPLSSPFPPPADDARLPGYISLASETLSGFAEINDIIRNERNRTTKVVCTNSGSNQYPWGIMHYTQSITHEVCDDRPAEAKLTSTYTMTLERDNQYLKWTGKLLFYSDENYYYYRYRRFLEDDDRVIRQKDWSEDIPRN